MFVSRVVTRISRNGLNQYRSLLVHHQQKVVPTLSNEIHSLTKSNTNKYLPGQVTLLHHPALSINGAQQFWYSSSPQPTDKETEQETVTDGGKNGDSKTVGQKEDEVTSSESDVDTDLSVEELVKLVSEKEELLKTKDKEFEAMKDKFLRSFAEMENVKDRTKREAENSKKFAIQNFAKSLLDVSDNLGRASSVVKESFSKIDASKDAVGAVPLLKTLLEGVAMTEKQLAEVFKKFGLEKYEPMDEQFDPNKHHAIFQVADASKPPGTVAAVLKAGYTLHDRIIRPAEVGVTQAVNSET